MIIETFYNNTLERDCNTGHKGWVQNFTKSSDGKFRFVYAIRNLVNEHRYIGQHTTENLDDNYFGSGNILPNAIKKHGKENLKLRMCCFCENKEDLNEAEKYWIAYFESVNRGYNISHGGNGGNMGELVNKKISDALKGKPLPESVLIKFRDGRRKGAGNSMYGKTRILKKVTCPHCKIIIDVANASKSHFDNCKQNPDFVTKEAVEIICPHCNKIGTGLAGMRRYHFDNCKNK